MMQQHATGAPPQTILHSQATGGAQQYWPEPLRDTARPKEPFPFSLILPWVYGSALVLLLLLAMVGYLVWRAGHEILFLNARGELAIVQADGSHTHTLRLTGLNAAQFGPPQWAHNGQQFAAIALRNSIASIVVARPSVDTPIIVQDPTGQLQLLPSSAWSVDDSRLVAIGQINREDRGMLALIDPARSQMIPVNTSFIPQTPLNWHPHESRLLITSYTPTLTPTLQIINPDGTSIEFDPQDSHVARSFGAWSPDGKQIAYIAIQDSRNNNLRGSIWIANSDGSNPQQIVKDGLNFAPVWSPSGDAIYFTRWLTETSSYDLYRVLVNGSNLIQIGSGVLPITPDGHPLLEWSPDRSKLIFQSINTSSHVATIWIANGDGANAQPIVTNFISQEYLPARWAPTGRALVLVTPEGHIVLHWIDAQRSETLLAIGREPDWQP